MWSLYTVTGLARQRASLELGFLTEELISRHELLSILTAGRRAVFSSTTVNWYYISNGTPDDFSC